MPLALSQNSESGRLTFRFQQTLLIALLIACFYPATHAAADFYTPLEQRLVKDGFSPTFIRQVYQSDSAPLFETVANAMRIRESKLNYSQFLSSQSISSARRFMRSHEQILAETEKTYGVDRCVIVAILSVETRFGSYTGSTPTLNILSTFALMNRKAYRDIVWRLMPSKDRQRWGRKAFDEKLIKRSEWAYGELRALLTWSQNQPARVRSFKGSLMGAVGWPQFLPSSLVRHGVDGNRDGQVDLFNPTDAIFSVAKYLTAYGWGSAASRAEKEKVIYSYNHSRPYVATVLGIADRLQQGD